MSRNVVRLDPEIPIDDMEPLESIPPEGVISGTPNTRDREWFASDDGRVSAGVWTCDTFREHISSFPYDELFLVVEGAVTITETGSVPQTFRAGDVFIVRGGTECDFAVSGPFRKVYVNYDPSDR